MYRQIPNQLTLLRLVLAAVFFVVLNQYRYAGGSSESLLPVAIGIFILAAVTDALDGYLARRWQVESTFGRIMDPFCDKVLIIGAFIYLAGPRFVIPSAVDDADVLVMVTGVYPWMVAIILARELLVTSVRGELEGKGVEFGAGLSGKLKMILQSIAIPVVLAIVYVDPGRSGWTWLGPVRDVLVYTTVIVTLISGLPYIQRAVQAVRVERLKKDEPQRHRGTGEG
ncbi:MAG: CDP-alcohol phosphatidyltransferase family protein [Phycisphaeraceae bacterium]